jgi:mannose-1-phosphate guanylyltransferase
LKAILLAAGLGTRLRPITDTIPKCMVPINGKPLLEIWLEKLDKAGINEILINTHYLSNVVIDFIHNSKYKEKCKLVHEEKLLGTAGTLLHNIDFIEEEDCLLIHADNFCEEDINNFIIAHNNRPKNCLLSILAFRTQSPTQCGIIETNESKILIGFHEKVENPPTNLASGAMFILTSKFNAEFKINYDKPFDFSKEIVPKYLSKIFVFETNKIFADIGTIDSYNEIKNYI